MQKQQNTFHTDMESENETHRRGALWLQDEVKSNRFRVCRVKSEDNLADIGKKALSNSFGVW